MLSATPYNKSYLDLSSQLRLFVPETADLGIRPERLLREIGEIEFNRRHQCPLRSLRNSVSIDFRDRAAAVCEIYATHYKNRFRWIRPDLFNKNLIKDLRTDAEFETLPKSQALFKAVEP